MNTKNYFDGPMRVNHHTRGVFLILDQPFSKMPVESFTQFVSRVFE